MSARWRSWGEGLLSLVLFFSLCLAADRVQAQSRMDGVGRVLAVDEANGTLSVDHGPMGAMPPMRMRLPVHNLEALKGIKVGDVIHFVLEVQNDALGVTSIEKTDDRQ